MAKISAFKGIIADDRWMNHLIQSGPVALKALKAALESEMDGDTSDFSKLTEMIDQNLYMPNETEAIYIYEQSKGEQKSYGVWSLTAVEDYVNEQILPHEDTILKRTEALVHFRSEIGLESRPVLLTNKPSVQINQMINNIVQETPFRVYCENGLSHKIWKVELKSQIEEITMAFSRIPKAYIADGHHRMEAAVQLQADHPQWISTLYVSTVDLEISAFHRLVLPDEKISETALFEAIQTYFYCKPISEDIDPMPDQLHQIAMRFEGKWHHLMLKPEHYLLQQQNDAFILQEKILKPLFGITDPRSDPRLTCYPQNQWEVIMNEVEAHPDAVLFGLYPVSIHQLIRQAEDKIPFPPKSTFIEPKIPYGIILQAIHYETNVLNAKHI